MSDFLQQMGESSARRAAAARSFTAADFDKPVHPLALEGFDLIAEIKNRSPAEGTLASVEGDRRQRALAYVDGGAAAISVLTEPERFDGDLAHLAEVVDVAGSVPVMRKDFLVDPYQVYEARAAGAGGVLLILRILDTATLGSCIRAAAECGLFVLLEAFDEADLQRAGPAVELCRREGASVVVGLNSRDLATLKVDFGQFRRLADRFPPGVARVAESGLLGPEQAREVAALAYDAALVGTSLMTAGDPETATRHMLAAARSAAVPHPVMWVKICGLTNLESVRAVAGAGADAAGFVFAESPRRVSTAEATRLAAHLPPHIARVAVFRQASGSEIAGVLSAFPADFVQCEPTSEARKAAEEAGARFLPVLHDGPDVAREADRAAESGERPAAILEAAGRGGRGIKPDWERAAALARTIPLVLAGGLTPGNVAGAIEAVRPFGVDVSSGVEEARGRKDPVRIAAFVAAARAAVARSDGVRGETVDREMK